ncbi:MAG: sigma-70 family RNA polymerase sigma factor [Fusobacteriaceae bacterium]|jgi:RNA polymerase sigma factor (sigma-70 family)|nr:sigma-70 family RNA polymerase sigma factor [Fusobacteriaceae bacterium]
MAKNLNPENIMVRDYEIDVFNDLESHDAFLNYLNRNKEKKLLLDYKLLEPTQKRIYSRQTEAVLDYLEEISLIIPETEQDLFLKNISQVASIAFYYLKDGISYLDIVQEGNLGLLNAIDNFKNSGFSNFNDYKNYWIIREMILFIKKRITDIQYEFESFFKEKYAEFSGDDFHEDDFHEDEEKDILESLEIIDKKEIKLKEKLDFFSSENRLTKREIEILKYYFGFEKEKRYSMYEIEKEMGLSSGEGEHLFKQALMILSDLDGRVVI